MKPLLAGLTRPLPVRFRVQGCVVQAWHGRNPTVLAVVCIPLLQQRQMGGIAIGELCCL